MIRQPSHHSDSRDPGVLARAWAIRVLFRWLRHGDAQRSSRKEQEDRQSKTGQMETHGFR